MTLSLHTRAARRALVLAVAVACAASAAGTVSAAPTRPDDRSGVRGVSTPIAGTQAEHITENSSGQRLDPAIEKAIASRRFSESTLERISEHSIGQSNTGRTALATASTSTATGFGWTDAGIGAGVTLVFLAFATASVLVLYRGRRRPVGA